jgi:multicomponent Na+:H+ antiporter subunit B
MPAFGDPNAPANTHVGQAYVDRTASEIPMPNIVTAVLASYRGYDTMGEVMVIFTAGVAVMLLLGAGSVRGGREVCDTDNEKVE